LAGQHGGERGELGEVKEYTRNKQDQAITRSNIWQGTLQRAVQCCSSIVSKEGHPSEDNLHNIKVVLTSEIFLTSHFTFIFTCISLCTLGEALCHSVTSRGMEISDVYGATFFRLVYGHRCLTGKICYSAYEHYVCFIQNDVTLFIKRTNALCFL